MSTEIEINWPQVIMAPDPAGDQPTGKTWRSLFRWHFTVVLAVTVFFGAIRWRMLDMPLERDEGEYAYAGQLILQGIPPYRLAYNMKLPGTYVAYAAIMAVLGQTARGIHLGLLLMNAISVVLLYAVAARLFGMLAGVLAASSYALLSTHPFVLGFAAHATHFVVLAALIGFIPLLLAEETKRTVFFFWSGIAFGTAFLMKQPGLFLGAFAFFYLAVQCWPKQKGDWGVWARNLGVFLFAGALPFALTCAALYRAGVFRNFWFWTFDYGRQYGIVVPWRAAPEELPAQSSPIFHCIIALWIVAFAGIVRSFWKPMIRRYVVFVFGLLAFSFAATCPTLRFRPHYFIVVMPAVAILIAVVITSAIRLLTVKFPSRWLQILPVLVFAAACVFAIHNNAEFYFKLTPIQACRVMYSLNPFPEAAPVAEYLRKHTGPSDAIMVFGSEPEIYFYAHRHSASGYIYTYSLTEDQIYWSVMQKQIMEEVEAERPAYLVFVDVADSWFQRPGSPEIEPFSIWMKQYISRSFEEVGMVEIAEPESRYFWGDEARAHPKIAPDLRIFKRLDGEPTPAPR
jgi:Dolichyl-phosphate-mannose-protein mannosyltransferase